MKDLWKGMQMPTRIVLIIGVVGIVIALILTGQLDIVINAFK